MSAEFQKFMQEVDARIEAEINRFLAEDVPLIKARMVWDKMGELMLQAEARINSPSAERNSGEAA